MNQGNKEKVMKIKKRKKVGKSRIVICVGLWGDGDGEEGPALEMASALHRGRSLRPAEVRTFRGFRRHRDGSLRRRRRCRGWRSR